jgi:hypothetical protein
LNFKFVFVGESESGREEPASLISRQVRSEEGNNLVQFGFKVDRAVVVKTGVKSGAIVEGLDVIEEGGASLGVGGEAMMIDQFVLEAARRTTR